MQALILSNPDELCHKTVLEATTAWASVHNIDYEIPEYSDEANVFIPNVITQMAKRDAVIFAGNYSRWKFTDLFKLCAKFMNKIILYYDEE